MNIFRESGRHFETIIGTNVNLIGIKSPLEDSRKTEMGERRGENWAGKFNLARSDESRANIPG